MYEVDKLTRAELRYLYMIETLKLKMRKDAINVQRNNKKSRSTRKSTKKLH